MCPNLPFATEIAFFLTENFLVQGRKNWFDFVVYHQYLTFLLLFFGDQEIKFTLTGSDPVTKNPLWAISPQGKHSFSQTIFDQIPLKLEQYKQIMDFKYLFKRSIRNQTFDWHFSKSFFRCIIVFPLDWLILNVWYSNYFQFSLKTLSAPIILT